MNRKVYFGKKIFTAGIVFLVAFSFMTVWILLCISNTFRKNPTVSVRANNIYDETLHVVTDIDYEPFSYVDEQGIYTGMDVEMIAEIANRLKMNLDLKLMDWTAANELFSSGGADAFLNLETDNVVKNNDLIATLPTTEKQYVVYGKEIISSVPELYGRKVVSLHKLPELGLGNGITYLDSYREIFEAMKRGEYEFAICPIQVGNVFLEKLAMKDIKPSYAVGHIYGAIALDSKNRELKNRIDAVINEIQLDGIIDALDKKWITNRYQNMTLAGMLKSYPEILAVLFVVFFLIVILVMYLILQNRNIKIKDEYSRQLVTAKEKAEESSKAKSEFLANMSHEIRTPINAVLGMNEMIIRESKDDKILVYARNVESAGKNLLSIINDILDFSKIEAGKMQISDMDYKLSSVLNDVTNMIVFKARQKDLKFHVNVDETLPDGLYGDEVRVRQVVTNVLNNAVKYTHEGSVALNVSGQKNNPSEITLVFKISDTGIGIKQEDLPKLFKQFERVNLVQNNTVEGTGLGLSITQNLLNLMNGHIEVESEYGKGSTFTIYLPQKITSVEQIGNFHEKFDRYVHALKAYQESFKAPDAHVLVVDDTIMNLTVITGLLSKTDIQLDTASSGLEALVLTKKVKYDLILMDQRMPQMDGTQALNNIRSQKGGMNTDTPVICLTADAVSGARTKYLDEGFTDYLSKPVESSTIEATMIKYLSPSKVILQKGTQESNQAVETETPLKKFYGSEDSLSYDDAVRFCVNEEILAKTLELFYRTIKINSDEIEKFFVDRDFRNYTIKVHALKSSARLIGAQELSDNASYLEECGNDLTDENISHIEELTPPLLSKYRAYIEKLAPLYSDREESTRSFPEISLEDLKEAYDAITEFAHSFDIDSIENIIAEVKKYRIPEEYRAQFEAIETATYKMDWNELLDNLSKGASVTVFD